MWAGATYSLMVCKDGQKFDGTYGLDGSKALSHGMTVKAVKAVTNDSAVLKLP